MPGRQSIYPRHFLRGWGRLLVDDYIPASPIGGLALRPQAGRLLVPVIRRPELFDLAECQLERI